MTGLIPKSWAVEHLIDVFLTPKLPSYHRYKANGQYRGKKRNSGNFTGLVYLRIRGILGEWAISNHHRVKKETAPELRWRIVQQADQADRTYNVPAV